MEEEGEKKRKEHEIRYQTQKADLHHSKLFGLNDSQMDTTEIRNEWLLHKMANWSEVS